MEVSPSKRAGDLSTHGGASDRKHSWKSPKLMFYTRLPRGVRPLAARWPFTFVLRCA
jgi:hypothetical protein